MAASDLLKRRRHSAAGEGGAAVPKVRLLCSFGGKILPRPHDHQLRYSGGETRLIVIPRSISFSLLHFKLSKLAEPSSMARLHVKYQLPHEDLDSLISVSCDEDVEIMMEEYDRASANGDRRFRVFLFQSSGMGSLNERWLEDAVKCGGAVVAPPLDDCTEASDTPATVEPVTPVYLVPARPVGPVPVPLHMSFGMSRLPVHAGPVWMSQSGPVPGMHRGSMGSMNPTGRSNVIYKGSIGWGR